MLGISGPYQSQVDSVNQSYRSPSTSGAGSTSTSSSKTPEEIANTRANVSFASDTASQVFSWLGDLNQFNAADADLSEKFRQSNVRLDLARQSAITNALSNAIQAGLSISSGAVAQQIAGIDAEYSTAAKRADAVYRDQRRSIENSRELSTAATIFKVVLGIASFL